MALLYVENNTDDWVPLEYVTPRNPAPETRKFFERLTPPTPMRRGETAPTRHMMRPHERLYWFEDALPEPPPDTSPKWQVLRDWLGCHSDRDLQADVAAFNDKCWVSEGPGSHGGRIDRFLDGQEVRTWGAHLLPQWRMMGANFWGGGHASGHNLAPMRALELYLRTKRRDAWVWFVLQSIHQIGQGLNWKYGNLDYEKSQWAFCGDFYPNRRGRSSHFWPETTFWFSFLTMECSDAVTRLADHIHAREPYWNGLYGIRRVAWWLRAVRCLNGMMDPDVVVDDQRARARIEATLEYAEQRDHSYFVNRASGAYSYVSPWMDGMFVSESLEWADIWDDEALLDRIQPFADWLLTTGSSEDGLLGYQWKDATEELIPTQLAAGSSWFIPGLAVLVRRGRAHVSRARVLTQGVIDMLKPAIPDGLNYAPWGSSKDKMGIMACAGLRPDDLQTILSV